MMVGQEQLTLTDASHPASETDLGELYELFAKAFPPSYFEAKSHLEFIRRNEPAVPSHNYFLVRGVEGDVVGGLKTVDRVLMLEGCPLQVAGLSYYAIAPKYQPTNCAQQIIKALLNHITSGRYDLSMGFARKVMDGYWSRYGFIGFTSFYSLTIEMRDVRALGSPQGVRLNTPGVSDEGCYNRFYEDTYTGITGAVSRDEALWDYWLRKIERNKHLRLAVFKERDKIVGYVVWRDNTVVELAMDTQCTPECLRRLADQLAEYKTLTFNLPYTHPVFRLLRQRNYVYSVRRVWDGGHIALVADVPRFLQTIHPVLARRLVIGGAAPFSLSCNQVLFRWDGTHLHLAEGKPPSARHRVEFHDAEWQKLLLGVEPATMLRGFASSGQAGVIDLLFPVLWPQVSELDEF